MIVILGLCFLLTDWLSFAEGEGVCLKFNVQGQGGGRILDVAGQVWMGGLENWKIFMDVIFASSYVFFIKYMRISNSVLYKFSAE